MRVATVCRELCLTLMSSARVRTFARAEEGAALVMTGFSMMVLLCAAGMAIDMSRAQMVESRMHNALDATGLAVGSEASTVDLNAETSKYFYANFPQNYIGTTVTTLTATPNEDNSVITFNVAGTVPTTFMQLFGVDYVAVSAMSEITRQAKGMELVLVMDTTGSMLESAGGSESKMDAAKMAAITLLNIVYGSGNNTVPNLWLGVVPFSQAVNIASATYGSWLDSAYAATLNWGTTSWYGCVEARTNGSSSPQYDVSDDPPSVQLFRPYYYPCNTHSSFPNGWYGTNSSRNNCLTGSGLQYKTGLSPSTLGPNRYCPVPVLSMVAEKNTVVDKINGMEARGATHISLGLAWGWRMLSPRWRGLWGGQMNSNSLPLDYNSPLMNKVVVLMTDGDNTLYGSNGSGTSTSNPGVYTAYGYPNNNWLAVSGGECNASWNCSAGHDEMNARTLAACEGMKANGIIIYTIALGADVSSTGQSILEDCATSSSHYFLSPTTDELDTIFQQIGDSLANLRISQ